MKRRETTKSKEKGTGKEEKGKNMQRMVKKEATRRGEHKKRK